MSKKLRLGEIRDKSHKLGNKLLGRYERSGNLDEAVGSIKAYRISLRASRLQLIYKQLGIKIDYFEK